MAGEDMSCTAVPAAWDLEPPAAVSKIHWLPHRSCPAGEGDGDLCACQHVTPGEAAGGAYAVRYTTGMQKHIRDRVQGPCCCCCSHYSQPVFFLLAHTAATLPTTAQQS
jgi:hypothetical protein